MKTSKHLIQLFNCLSITSLSALLLAGCESRPQKPASGSSSMSTTAPATAATPAATAAPTAAASAAASTTPKVALPIRIKAGGGGFTDSSGNVWLPDHGFTDGDTVERPELSITNAADQRLYQSERYSMTKFTQQLPNGKYTVKLHFCETFEGITGPGQRVFSFNVAGQHDFKDFDVWVKAGGPQRAYIEPVPVDVTNGTLEITFTENVEHPEINAIEILPGT